MRFVTLILLVAFVSAAFAQTGAGGKKSVKEAQAATQQVSDAKLKLLESAYKSAKADFAKKPKDAKVKKAYVNATFAVGMGRMYSVSLPPRQKYTTALDAFREVLKTDPNHKEAKANHDMIVKIYKDMGRPVPGGN